MIIGIKIEILPAVTTSPTKAKNRISTSQVSKKVNTINNIAFLMFLFTQYLPLVGDCA